MFTEQLQALADGRGAKDILAVIRADANLRNQVLYAADDGIPEVQKVDAFLLGRRRPVFILLALTIMILQTKQIQLFAVQALHAYLSALGKAAQAFDYQAAIGPPSSLAIKIVSKPRGSAHRIHRTPLRQCRLLRERQARTRIARPGGAL